ncbi:MAG: hypothetical protein AABX28_00450 [Nanoarchaeota archaeon]
MTNFIKNIFDGKTDENAHLQFIRFGKGEFNGRFILNLVKSKKIKVKTSFELANDLVLLCSEFGNSKVSGDVLSKKDISEIMSQNNIKGNSETKKGGLYYQSNISNQEMSGEQIRKLAEVSYFMLLDMEGDGFSLKMKKKLPKPGKNENKIDGKFCQLETDEKFYSIIRENLFWDVKEGKKINVKHNISIKELIFPKNEKDFAVVREKALRKGKIVRCINTDGKEMKEEKEFEA